MTEGKASGKWAVEISCSPDIRFDDFRYVQPKGFSPFEYDPRFWIVLPLPASVEAGVCYPFDLFNPKVILLSRFVLPIRGCGNDLRPKIRKVIWTMPRD